MIQDPVSAVCPPFPPRARAESATWSAGPPHAPPAAHTRHARPAHHHTRPYDGAPFLPRQVKLHHAAEEGCGAPLQISSRLSLSAQHSPSLLWQEPEKRVLLGRPTNNVKAGKAAVSRGWPRERAAGPQPESGRHGPGPPCPGPPPRACRDAPRPVAARAAQPPMPPGTQALSACPTLASRRPSTSCAT